MYVGGVCFIDGKVRKTRIPKGSILMKGRAFWTAVKNKYFCIILTPDTMGDKVIFSRIERKDDRTGIKSLLSIPLDPIPPGSRYEENLKIYVGPKRYEIVKNIAKDTERILDLGWFAPLSKVTLFILKFFYRLVHNYGVAIILLTILVRIILYPLTYKSYKSMSEMQKLQPYIMELQKKYKKDPKRLHKEMMILYKEHGVNPFGGCLPMLLQLPILIALYTTIRNAIELRGAPFCLWIKDLSEPDTLFRLSNGFPVNLLPIIMLGTFFLQYRFMHTPVVTPEQKQHQKIMNIIMPIFMGFIFYNMPSGLVLYFTLSTLIGVIDQYRIKKRLS